MSGFAGICHFDGSPVSGDLLDQMKEALRFRGPDCQSVRRFRAAGFAHTLLRTCDESAGEAQPLSLDGTTWIVADVRLDRRSELIAALKPFAGETSESTPDVELILRAWLAWGEDCVDHLYGDFSFAIWDDRAARLFCARDHLGVKPFYYSRNEHGLVFSNTLNCLRLHPSVSSALNPVAVADYLLFGYKIDPETTTFRDIHRLPAAQTLRACSGETSCRPYWRLSPERCVRYRKRSEYLDHFEHLFRKAVGDRLRTDKTAIFLSGGMDSSSVAAIARELLTESGRPFEIRAFTVVDDQHSADRERYYSGLVAAFLGLPAIHLEIGAYRPFQNWDDEAVRGTEPVGSPFGAIAADQFRQVQAFGRVVLSGQGGDQAFLPTFNYFFDLLRRRRLVRLTTDAVRCIQTLRRVPRFGLRSGFRNAFAGEQTVPPLPVWINPSFTHTHHLEQRWREYHACPPMLGPRPEAFRRLSDASLCLEFELNDPGQTGVPVEVRCPLYDVHLIEFLLAIPPVPWCFDKGLLRLAMRGRLPDAVLQRPKTPFQGDLLAADLARGDHRWLDDLQPHERLAEFVDWDRIPLRRHSPNADHWTDIRPLAFNQWLSSLTPRR